ncbi:hypothetical protein [uncultured Acetatifactor sp.]|uniref:hypothetical protein n=1 Tax=uncultured Acetatifactor sp. TaxID=1671927 RepID=UPI00260242A6|nr:hypothetical protein [uncultured Acetatifactor sp.]
MKPLEYFLRPTQRELFAKLRSIYKGRADVCRDSYILVKGEAPVLLVAHLDTVHPKPVKQICMTGDGGMLMSPQGIGGDDRCGVYALNAVYEQSEAKPWLLFTCDEEVGGIGASVFCVKQRKGVLPKELKRLKLIIEIDRKGKDDAVYYGCGNKAFEDYITGKGFRTSYGSFSDISYIAPELGIAAVNLSAGYYNAHTLHEYINRKHLEDTVRKVIGIVAESIAPDFPRYEYAEARCYYRRGWDRYGIWRGDEKILESLPRNIREEYGALLDCFTVEELEAYRVDYGDGIILQLYEAEFSGTAHPWPKGEPAGWGNPKRGIGGGRAEM